MKQNLLHAEFVAQIRTLITHAVLDSYPDIVPDFGPGNGNLYANATSSEEVRVSHMHQKCKQREIDTFKKFIQLNTSRKFDLSLLRLSDEDLLDLHNDFKEIVRSKVFTMFLIGGREALLDTECDLLCVTEFSPGLAVLCLREPKELEKNLLRFFDRTLEASCLTREEFISLTEEKKHVWCNVWTETLLCHVHPLGLGICESHWGEPLSMAG